MKKVFKRDYAARFTELAVKRAQAVGTAAAADELGLVEEMLCDWMEAAAASRLHERCFETTDPRPLMQRASPLWVHCFGPEASDRVWIGDVTCIRTGEGGLYLAIVMDLSINEIVGWSIKPDMTGDNVIDALTMAWSRRKPDAGVIFRCDRSAQTVDTVLRAKLAQYGMTASISHGGNGWYQAPTKHFFISLRSHVHPANCALPAVALPHVLAYIDFFNHRSRRDSSLELHQPPGAEGRPAPGGVTVVHRGHDCPSENLLGKRPLAM